MSSTARLFRFGVGVYQGSVLSPLLFIIVLEALPKAFHTACPWELLYADELMISAGSMEELLEKINTLKFRDGEESSTYVLEEGKHSGFGINIGLPNTSGIDPCSVLQTGVRRREIFCGGFLCW